MLRELFQKRPRFNMRTLLLVVTVVAVAGYWFSPPLVRASVRINRIGTESIAGHEFLAAECRMTNTAPNSLWYWGFSKDEPIYRLQTPKDGKWVEVMKLWCGVGLEPRELKPGESMRFDARVQTDANCIRVCVDFSGYKNLSHGLTIVSQAKCRQ